MSVTVELPKSLVTELWGWYNPKDEFAPIGDAKVSHPGKYHDLKSCFRSEEAYKENFASIRALKDLRQMVSSLASTIDNGIERMERQLLPVSRHRGIRLFPGDVVITIMNIVGECIEHDPTLFESTMRGFVCTPPFNTYFKDATTLQQKWWKQQDTSWVGLPPLNSSARGRPLSSITTFHFSLNNNLALSAIQKGLKPLRSLEYLSITCNFDLDIITEGVDLPRTVPLPNLRNLNVSNLAQENWSGLCFLGEVEAETEPLRRIVDMLDMPQLSSISAAIISSHYLSASEGIQAINMIFAFPDRPYETVKAFDIRDLRLRTGRQSDPASIELQPLFASCPNLAALAICFYSRIDIALRFSLVLNSNLPLEYLTLKFGKVHLISAKHVKLHAKSWATSEIKALMQEAELKEITLKTDYVNAGLLQIFQKIYPNTRSVTDRSILE